MKKLKILFSLVGMFTVFSFMNVNAMEKTSSNVVNKKQEEQKKEERFSPIHVDLENDVIYLDFLEEDEYSRDNNRIAYDVEKYLDDIEKYLATEKRGRDLNDYIEYLPSYLSRKATDYKYKGKQVGEEIWDGFDSHDKRKLVKSLIYEKKAKEYKLLENFFDNCKFELVYDDELYYDRSGKFKGKAILKMKNFNFEGLEKKEKLKEVLKLTAQNSREKLDPSEIEAFRAVKIFCQAALVRFFKCRRTINQEIPQLGTEYVLDVNKDLCVDYAFEDIKEYVYSANEWRYIKVKFDGSQGDFEEFYKLLYRMFNYDNTISDIYIDKIYGDVFDPDNFKNISLIDNGNKIKFKFKDVKTMKKYEMKLLDFKEYINRLTKISHTNRADQISLIALLYPKFVKDNKTRKDLLAVKSEEEKSEEKKKENVEKEENKKENVNKEEYKKEENEENEKEEKYKQYKK